MGINEKLRASLSGSSRGDIGDVETIVLEDMKKKPGETVEERKEAPTPFLDKFGRDLTKLAREGKLEPCIGRRAKIKKFAQILLQKRKMNPLLVG
ncbi:MAG: hypothetical protein RMI30_06465 [Thermodesulfovibrio sp.]|nr:hypothetical protein [Thermodesulfovibrio sp.]